MSFLEDFEKTLKDKCYQDDPPYCQSACPFFMDIKALEDKWKKGRFNAAYRVFQTACAFPGIVAEICDEVAVMYAGKIIEKGTLEDVFNRTKHPYTEGLFNSIPNINDRKAMLTPIKGMMPDPTNLPEGCAFEPRCPYAGEDCKLPQSVKHMSDTHYVRCCAYDRPGFHIDRKEKS